jgi:predicted PurR-regulated permease PerM
MKSIADSARAPAARKLARTGFLLALMGLCAWLLWGFVPALVWALIIAIASWPLRQRVAAGLGSTSAAALLTLVVALLAVLPFALFGAEIAREAASLIELADAARRGQLQPPDWLAQLPFIGADAVSWWRAHLNSPDSPTRLLDSSQTASAIQIGRDVGRSVVRRFVTLGFTILTLFFLYKDGGRIAGDAERLALRFFGSVAGRYGRFAITAVRTTVNGLVFVGLGEGLLLGLAYLVCGVPHPIAFAVATAVLGIVPFGAPLVLAIAGLTLIFSARVAIGIALFGGGLIAIFIADHTARPALIGGAIRLPFFWALLGVFGGLESFGIIGLFLGPAILAVALTIWREAVAAASTLNQRAGLESR